MILYLRAKPNARRNQLLRAADGTLTVQPASPAPGRPGQCGTAGFFGRFFGVPISNVALLSGHTSPFKKVEIEGIYEAEGERVLSRLPA